MNIKIEWFPGERPQFNVALASAEGKEPFITVKGCRLVSGSNGEFVSWPATKSEKTGKYWQHVWASEAFAVAVLDEAKKSQTRAPARGRDDDSEIPF